MAPVDRSTGLVAACLALILGTAALPACEVEGGGGELFGHAAARPDPRRFTWCNSGEPESLDPGLSNATPDLRIIEQIFDGLLTYDAAGLPRASLARSWEMSPDASAWTFHLRDDARWSNGRPITAEDVRYTVARVLHPLTASRNAGDLWRVAYGKSYHAGTARLVLADHPPFRRGDVVVAKEGDPDPGLRRVRTGTPLREAPLGRPLVELPAGAEVTIVELGGASCPVVAVTGKREPWRCTHAFVHRDGDDGGVLGWVPLSALLSPAPERQFSVTLARPDGQPAADGAPRGTVPGRDLLMLPELLGIEAPDPLTVTIRLTGPWPQLLDMVAAPVWRPVPREAVARAPRRWTRAGAIVTSGPFHLVAWKERDGVRLVRSATFWGRASVRLEEVNVLSVSSQAAAVNLYFYGGCDATAVNHIPASYLPMLAGQAGPSARSDYVRAATFSGYNLLVNVERLPSVHLRRALAHALDREELVTILRGGQLPTTSFVPGRVAGEMTAEERETCGLAEGAPGLGVIVGHRLCYHPPPGLGPDEAAARRELELARAELGARFPPVIELKLNSGTEQHRTIAEWAQFRWGRVLGLKVELVTQDWKSYLAALDRGEFQAARIGFIGNYVDPEVEFLAMWRCGAPDNRSRYCDPEYDRLLREAGVLTDRSRRLVLLEEAEARMIAAVPVIPLYVYRNHYLIKPYVRGMAINATDKQPLREVWIDPDWTRQPRAQAGR